ncbi:site-specific integrase [Dyadobacter sp. OTU695]|uniref:site-specific integrase n=1 Tax=Dyadobacter sp. OTU695 TaxID=3043860 RepID=UPI00313D9D62
MEAKMSAIFYARRSKATKEKLWPIYLRITISGKRFDTSANRQIEPSKWSVEAGRMKGSSIESKTVNTFLDTLLVRAYGIQREILEEGKKMSIDVFRTKWLGAGKNARTLIGVFKDHNKKMEQLIGIDYAYATFQRYQTSLQHTENFLKWKFKVPDVHLTDLNYQFISDFEFYLKTVCGCGHNSTMKYLSNFKKIVLTCVKNDWLHKDPFFAYRMPKTEVDRVALSAEELLTVIKKKFVTERLRLVRDIFVFSCYTGLAYVDVQKLRRSEITIGIDGGQWLQIKRQKTESRSSIPLLPEAINILNKYENHPQCASTSRLLPVLSNQKMNAYLKEIADVCGIEKNITFHLARHTFATTVTLANGVPTESVSKMLGHRDLRTTQLYAKVIDSKISEDMRRLKESLIDKLGKSTGI